MSIRQLHERLGGESGPWKGYASVHRFVTGEARPPLDFLKASAEILNVPAGFLAFGEDPRPLAEREVEREGWRETAKGEAALYAPPHVIEEDREELRRRFGAAPPLYILVGIPASTVNQLQELAHRDERSLGGLASELLTKAVEAAR